MKQYHAAKTRHGFTRMLACCKEIPKEKQKSLSCQTAVLDFFIFRASFITTSIAGYRR
jgi:hypothetical protein